MGLASLGVPAIITPAHRDFAPGGGLVRRLASLAAGALLLTGTPAAAAVYTVGARTEAQAYQFRSWQGRAFDDPEKLSRYQISQYLDLGAFDLLSSAGKGSRLDFVTYMRLENDFGFDEFEQNRLDEAEQPAFHLLYAYLHWQGIAGGVLDLKLGRQIRYDQLEFFSFDGLDIHVHTPAFVGIGVFGGWQVKGTSIGGSDTFQPDGVRVSDRRRIAAGVTTDLLANPASNIAYDYLDEPSPMFGGRLQLENVKDVDALVVYRRAMSKTTGANLEALPEEARGWQVDFEHLGAGARVRFLDAIQLSAAADRDMYRERWAVLRGAVKADLIADRLSITAEAQRWNPSFDADSIWNVFASGPRDELELRVDGLVGDFLVYGGPLLTLYNLDLGQSYADRAGIVADGVSSLYGGLAGFSTRAGIPWRIAGDVLYLGGPSGELGHADTLGRELWVSGVVGRTFRDRYGVDLRLNLANVSDPNAVGLQDLWSFGAAVIGRIVLSDEATVTVVIEENTNRLVTSDLRGYATLDLRTMFR